MLRVVTEWTDIVPPVTGVVGSFLTSLCILTVELILHKYKCTKVVMAHYTNKLANTIQIYPADKLHKHPTQNVF
jgi:hypothetical protein